LQPITFAKVAVICQYFGLNPISKTVSPPTAILMPDCVLSFFRVQIYKLFRKQVRIDADFYNILTN
jgi:hypothetical protein